MSKSSQKISFTIRPARLGDEREILSLIRDLAEFERLSDQVVATESAVKQHLFSDNPKVEVILAESDLQVIGFALFFTSFSTFLGKPGIYLEDLFVKPDFRNQGVGLALLKTLASIVVSRGGGRLEWSVLNWNQDAIRFYESVGAKPMNEWTVYRLTGEALHNFAK